MPSCPDCDFETDTEHGLNIHRSKTHRSGKVDLECEWCGSDFTVKRARRDTARFCSSTCQGKYKSEHESGENSKLHDRIETECTQCGDPMKITHSTAERNENTFCSKSCYSEWMSENQHGEAHHQYDRVTKRCEQCGDGFDVRPSVADLRRHCSQECASAWRSEAWNGEDHPSYNGGHEEYRGPNWQEQREKALERDGHKCRRCGRGENAIGKSPHVHHRLPIRFFKEKYDDDRWYELGNDLENLITLCPRCHRLFEVLPVQPEA
ncbi:HNH endonuclease [Halorubrum tailed virus 28]|uniref:HNH endonuclease n=1 Tax=Halorubrum tailed virus 28 TaxID=2878009 RepID=A0AAE8Y097_9CAUD|nr:HNH endonuclease [Halorubrum tailed virus 28]UBF23467.1 HNH endonuclease [Halorubrum tailed virus 28]